MSELTVPAAIEQLSAVHSFVNDKLEACPHKERVQIETAVEEIFVNIARYAYHPQTGNVTIRCKAEDGSVAIQFLDRGVPFNPLSREDADTTLSAEARNIGGLGILMVKGIMDVVDYAYTDSTNILTIKKSWQAEK
jgi:anti-sigma regulatory factor (Ser/Thr protein kinase)